MLYGMKCLGLIQYQVTVYGKIVDKNFKELFSKYKFDYTNSYSISDNSIGSLSALVNFKKVLPKVGSNIKCLKIIL